MKSAKKGLPDMERQLRNLRKSSRRIKELEDELAAKQREIDELRFKNGALYNMVNTCLSELGG